MIPTGRCFQLYSDTEIISSAIVSDVVLFNMTTIELRKLSFVIYFHNLDQLIPSLGMSKTFLAQDYSMYTPKANFVNQIQVTVNHRKNLNREEKPCVQDEGYSIYRCTEEFIRKEIGCSSPWDLHNDDEMKKCTTNEDINSLYALQRRIMGLGSPQFLDLTKY